MLRVRTVFTGVPGTPWYSNLYFEGTTQEAAGAAHDRVVDFWDAVGTLQNSTIDGIVEGEVMQIDPVTGLPTQAHSVTPVATGGTSPNETLPYATQALMRLETGTFQAGRRIRGRCFIPGLCEPDMSFGFWTSGLITTLTTAAAILITPEETSTLVVWSRRYGVERRVSSVSVPNKPAVLRSRRD